MPHFEVELDHVTGNGAKAEGSFQVISITDESCMDRTSLVKQGKQYRHLNELLADIAHALGRDHDDITLEEV